MFCWPCHYSGAASFKGTYVTKGCLNSKTPLIAAPKCILLLTWFGGRVRWILLDLLKKNITVIFCYFQSVFCFYLASSQLLGDRTYAEVGAGNKAEVSFFNSLLLKKDLNHLDWVGLVLLMDTTPEFGHSCCVVHFSVSSHEVRSSFSQCNMLSLFFCFCQIREKLIQIQPLSQTNGNQSSSSSSSFSAPSSPFHRVSAPARPGTTPGPTYRPQSGSVKTVTGVGGTTYEISVWVAAGLHYECEIWDLCFWTSHQIGCLYVELNWTKLNHPVLQVE